MWQESREERRQRKEHEKSAGLAFSQILRERFAREQAAKHEALFGSEPRSDEKPDDAA